MATNVRNRSLSLGFAEVSGIFDTRRDRLLQQEERHEGDDLLRNLQILKQVQRMDSIKLDVGKQKVKAALPKRGNTDSRYAILAPASFSFTNDMFNRSNVQAFNHATYQIISTVFPEEVQLKFRNCWPTVDRKSESEYRRFAFNWVQEISEKYPRFFKDAKPQFGYFVTPAGKRCERFLLSLADCALFILAERKSSIRGKGNQKSEECRDPTPDVKLSRNEQMKIKTAVKMKRCEEILQRISERELKQKDFLAKQKEHDETTARSRAEQDRKVKQLINDMPELFPENANEMIRSTTRFHVVDGREFESRFLEAGSDCQIKDKLVEELKQKWTENLTTFRDEAESLQTFFDGVEKNVIEVVKGIIENYDVTVDAKNYPKTFKVKGNALPDLEDSMSQIIPKAEAIQKLFPNNSSLLLHKPYFAEAASQAIEKGEKLLIESSAVIASAKPPISIEDLRFRIKVNEMSFEGVDWKKLVPMTKSTLDVDRALQLTPPKPLDFDRTTGLTPNFETLTLATPEVIPKVNRLMESIRLSASFTNNCVTTLKDVKSVRERMEESLDLHLDSSINENIERKDEGKCRGIDTSELEFGILEGSMSMLLLDGSYMSSPQMD